MILEELLPLHVDVVVHVVAIGDGTQGFPQDVVLAQHLNGVEQRGRHRFYSAVGDLGGGQLVQILQVGITRIHPAIDAVEACGEHDRQSQIRVGRPVHDPVFDASRLGHTQHLGAVVAAIARVGRRPCCSGSRRTHAHPFVGVDGR